MVTIAKDVKKQTSNSNRKKKLTKIPLGLSHLVTGFVNFDRADILIIDKKSSPPLETLRNKIFFIKNPKGEIKTFISNKNGVVNNLKSKSIVADDLEFRSVVGKDNLEKEIFMAPPEAVKLAFMAYGLDDKNWDHVLVDFFKKQKQGIKLKVIPLYKSYFRAPNNASKDEDEIQYKKWYQGFDKSERHTGILFPKVRSAFLLFNSPKDLIDKISIIYPESSTLKGQEIPLTLKEDGDVTYCVLVGNNAELTVDDYVIKVSLASPGEAWCKKTRTNKSYSLVIPIRFSIHNLAGDFDIINCDPISLESSMIQQFPVMLNHVTKLLKDDIKKDKVENKKNAFKTIKNKGIVQYGKNMHWAMDKTNGFLGAIDESSYKRMSQFTLLISKFLVETDSQFKAADTTLRLVFGSIKTYKDWKDHLTPVYLILKDKAFADMAKFMTQHTDGFYQNVQWIKVLTKYYKENNKTFPQVVLDIRKIGKSEKRIKQTLRQFNKLYPDEVKNLEKNFGASGKGLSKNLDKIGVALSVIDLGLQIGEICATNKDLDKNKKSNNELYEEYDEKLKGLPSKEVMELCEKYRGSTVAGHLKLEKEKSQAYEKAFDTALNVVALTPTPAGIAANIIILAIGTYKLVSDVWTSGTDALDDFIFDSYFKEKEKIKQMVANMSNGSIANQKLMPTQDELKDEIKNGKTTLKLKAPGTPEFEIKVGPHYYHLQYRIRAESLYGLMSLIMLASIKSDKDDESSFKKKCEEYKIQEYIKYFVLSDEWCFDLSIYGRIGLETWWLSNKSKYAKKIDNAPTISGRWAMSLSIRNYLNDGKKQMAIRPIANFQQHFPIHKYVSDDLFSFAKYFTPVDIIGNTSDWIEKTCVYYRGKDSRLDSDWRLINQDNAMNIEDLKLLTPFCQIRVLVVLKEKNADGKKLPEGIFPVNLQIHRTDGSNCTGPVYRNIIRVLADEMLLENKHEFDYMGKNRKGTVFYPFYEFGEQILFGTKPLINSTLWKYTIGLVTDGLLRWGGGYGVSDMTYAFKLKLGKTNEDNTWIQLGSENETTQLNEFRMGIDFNDPEQKKLNEQAFLESHSKDYILPLLFDKHRVLFQYYIKVGNKMHCVQGGYKQQLVLEINDFNWNDEVEIYLLLSVHQLHEEDYKATNWRSIPATAVLCNSDDGRNAKGQDFATRFHYLGDYKVPEGNGMFRNVKDPLTLRPNSKYNKPDAISLLPKNGTFDEFIKYFNWKDGLIRTTEALDKAFASYDHTHLFVAKLEMQYENPFKNGEVIKALRPIAKTKPKEGVGYFNYTIRNVISDGNSNLSREYTEFDDSSRGVALTLNHMYKTELTLRVKAPKDYTANVPWVGLSNSQVDLWLGKLSK